MEVILGRKKKQRLRWGNEEKNYIHKKSKLEFSSDCMSSMCGVCVCACGWVDTCGRRCFVYSRWAEEKENILNYLYFVGEEVDIHKFNKSG
jgi:hypothetical protein